VRPFAKGGAGNPGDRPRRSTNRATRAAERLLDGEANGADPEGRRTGPRRRSGGIAHGRNGSRPSPRRRGGDATL